MTNPVEISTSEELLPLIGMAQHRGLEVLSHEVGAPEKPAHIIFKTPQDAMEFLEHTAHHSAYVLGDEMALTIIHPIAVNGAARGKVTWMPHNTAVITGVWSKEYKGL